MKRDEKHFRTTSLPMATFLFAKGQSVAGISEAGHYKKEFAFELSLRLEELVGIYKFGSRDDEGLLVQVHLYEHARTELLDRLNGN
jgi:hypothetical protein